MENSENLRIQEWVTKVTQIVIPLECFAAPYEREVLVYQFIRLLKGLKVVKAAAWDYEGAKVGKDFFEGIVRKVERRIRGDGMEEVRAELVDFC